MKPMTIAPPASYSPDYKSAPLPLKVPSAVPPPEPQGRRERSGLATGSLPVSSAEVFFAWLHEKADNLRTLAADARSNGFAAQSDRLYAEAEWAVSLADEVRRELRLSRARQPEENTK